MIPQSGILLTGSLPPACFSIVPIFFSSLLLLSDVPNLTSINQADPLRISVPSAAHLDPTNSSVVTTNPTPGLFSPYP